MKDINMQAVKTGGSGGNSIASPKSPLTIASQYTPRLKYPQRQLMWNAQVLTQLEPKGTDPATNEEEETSSAASPV